MAETSFYTGKGDGGDTARLGGVGRLSKSDALLATVGVLDEATCAIGLARAHVQDTAVQAVLPEVQRHLYRLMSHISATPELRERYPGVTAAEVGWLEAQIAVWETDLPPLRDFVLPGESPAGAACHVARTVVRRAERYLVAFSESEPGVLPDNLAYVNRLSSLLFVAALREDQRVGRAPRLAREA